MDLSKLKEQAAAKQAQKFLARKFYPIYKDAQRQTALADAGAELREILYFIKTARPGRLYRGMGGKVYADRLNYWSDYYRQGKQFYMGQVNCRKGIKVRVLHQPEIDINFLKDLSVSRYNPESYKHQKVD